MDSGTLEIDGLEIHYALEFTPRRHWAYRDDRPLVAASMRSPFAKHSAEIIEYWSFAAEPRKRWLEVLESLPANLPSRLAHLGFPLGRRPDRVGNLMIAGAEDAIACDLVAHHDRTLRFRVDANELLTKAYRATVWATHSGDEVLRREVSVTPGQTVIEVASDVDHIGFAIYRTADGQCVDLMETFLIMEVGVRMEIESGPTLHIRNRQGRSIHEVKPAGPISKIEVHSDNDSPKLDKGIRRLWLDRQIHEREAAARREGNFARFEPQRVRSGRPVLYRSPASRLRSDGADLSSRSLFHARFARREGDETMPRYVRGHRWPTIANPVCTGEERRCTAMVVELP